MLILSKVFFGKKNRIKVISKVTSVPLGFGKISGIEKQVESFPWNRMKFWIYTWECVLHEI